MQGSRAFVSVPEFDACQVGQSRTMPRLITLDKLRMVGSLAALLVYSLHAISCASIREAKNIKAVMITDLPLGTEKARVEQYLRERNVPYFENGWKERRLSGADSRLYEQVSASIDKKSWTFSNAKISLDFYFDATRQLVDIEVFQTVPW